MRTYPTKKLISWACHENKICVATPKTKAIKRWLNTKYVKYKPADSSTEKTTKTKYIGDRGNTRQYAPIKPLINALAPTRVLSMPK